MRGFITSVFYAGMFLLAARFAVAFVGLALVWTGAMVRRLVPEDRDQEKMVAAQFSVPISFVLVPAADESPEIFISRVRSALASGYPEFEVILALPAANRSFVSNIREAIGLHKVWMVSRKVVEAPKEAAVYKTPGESRLTVLEIETLSRGGLLDAAVNFSTYPLLCITQGSVAPDTLAALIVPFARDPGGCACSIGALMPGGADRRSGLFWLYNAAKLCGAAASVLFQSRAGLPDVTLLLRKYSVTTAGGFGRTGRFEGLLRRIHSGVAPRGIHFIPQAADFSALHLRGGWLAKEWALGKNAVWRLGRIGAAISALPPFLELSAWCAALLACLTGAVPPRGIAVFVVLSMGCACLFSLLAIFMQEVCLRLHIGARKLLFSLIFCAFEFAGPRQLLLALRTISRLAGACKPAR